MAETPSRPTAEGCERVERVWQVGTSKHPRNSRIPHMLGVSQFIHAEIYHSVGFKTTVCMYVFLQAAVRSPHTVQSDDNSNCCNWRCLQS